MPIRRNLLVVLVHPREYILFGAGDPFRDEVVHIQVRERLEHPHGIELAVAEDRLDGDVIFRTLDEPPDNAVDLVRRVLVPR
jgi:hypothetical protein